MMLYGGGTTPPRSVVPLKNSTWLTLPVVVVALAWMGMVAGAL
ncbi:MAG: hypothetical protein ABSD29_16195 [Verrucomicrobiota bacterium]